MSKPIKVSVLAGGAFGTAMAQAASYNNYIQKVQIFARDANLVEGINKNKRNPKFFSEFQLSEKVSATTDLQEAIQDCTYILSCIPVQQFRPFLREHKGKFTPTVPLVSCSKGIILETGQLISEVVAEELGPQSTYVVLSGPTFAEEIMKKFPTLIVAASTSEKAVKLVQHGLSSQYFRVLSQKDVKGVELAGALKNILAIGAGLLEGKGLGYNSTTAYLARGVREMQLVSRLYGGDKHTFYGLAGIGDLMLTSFGKLSRNRQCGVRLGQGESLKDIIASSKGVVEGIPTLEFVYLKAKEANLNIPITIALYNIIHGHIKYEDALKDLMTQQLNDEFPPTFEDLL